MKESKLCQHNHDDYQNASTAWRQTTYESGKQRKGEREIHYKIKKNDIKFLDDEFLYTGETRYTFSYSHAHIHSHSHSHSQAYENNSVHIKSGKIN